MMMLPSPTWTGPTCLFFPSQMIFQSRQELRLLCPALLADLSLREKGGAETSELLLLTGGSAEEADKGSKLGLMSSCLSKKRQGERAAPVLPSLRTGTNQDKLICAHP